MRPPSYAARVLSTIDNGPGIMKSLSVGVFRSDGTSELQVGSYVRNYASLFNTFHHFTVNDIDYALYSPNYTGTRILKLPECQDIGGEPTDSMGFCPTDYYVPSYIDREWLDENDRPYRTRVNDPKGNSFERYMVKRYRFEPGSTNRIEVEKPSYPVSPHRYHPFALVAGCVWGDDSTWKIQYLDLANADRGVVRRDGRFGYIILPEQLSLRQAVEIDWDAEDESDPDRIVRIAVVEKFNLITGQRIQ